jgi:ABC-type transport system involved in multi-copper enzyme maturation permease subunit
MIRSIIRIFFAEWRKLRRPTLLLGTLGAVSFFSVLISSVLFLMIDSPEGNGDRGRQITREMLSLSSGATQSFSSIGGLLGIIALCVFAAQTAQEYSLGTLRNLLVRQPGRIRILIGKLASMKTFAMVMTLVSAIISIGVSYALAGGKNVSTELWFNGDGRLEIAKTLLNVFLSILGFGIIGMVLGIVLRSPISSISIGVLWLLIVENIVGALKSSTLNWLPGNQLSTIATGGSENVSYSHALSLSAIYVSVALVIATVLFTKRDVSN